ncbi:hypothetical protein R1sor_000265 [Riccia sorocarpa]|uniref:Uncharacterized protein n=1 Tax=Riccia sorocarpa TaxID=122646 RepID=A0ABD3GSV4_9MARC
MHDASIIRTPIGRESRALFSRHGRVFFAYLAESRITTLKETKVWLELKSGGGCRVVRAWITRFGLRGTATYLGCPICLKSIYSCDRRSHDFSSPKTLYRLKAFLQDDSGELEATAWEATRCFTGMRLEEFVAREMRERCIGKMWILRLSRAENQRGVYARIEYAEVVSRKVLFRGSSTCREGTVAEALPSSPVSTISAFGDGSSPVSTELQHVIWNRKETAGEELWTYQGKSFNADSRQVS